ncbi:hypothetical protein HWV62_29290 [Athelia sp. TMB]|nr:hypothetical protein HWV62_29290 [Athelia sp. TMB]
MAFRPYASSSTVPPAPPRTTEFEILKASHKFLRDEDDEGKKKGALSWDEQVAAKYYATLYREFAVCDLKHYKSGNVRPSASSMQAFALRWRTESEVLSSAGEATCGNTRCPHHESPRSGTRMPALSTLELPFAYEEHGDRKTALVKVVLCGKCVKKLMWKREKERAGAAGQTGEEAVQGQVSEERVRKRSSRSRSPREHSAFKNPIASMIPALECSSRSFLLVSTPDGPLFFPIFGPPRLHIDTSFWLNRTTFHLSDDVKVLLRTLLCRAVPILTSFTFSITEFAVRNRHEQLFSFGPPALTTVELDGITHNCRPLRSIPAFSSLSSLRISRVTFLDGEKYEQLQDGLMSLRSLRHLELGPDRLRQRVEGLKLKPIILPSIQILLVSNNDFCINQGESPIPQVLACIQAISLITISLKWFRGGHRLFRQHNITFSSLLHLSLADVPNHEVPDLMDLSYTFPDIERFTWHVSAP